MLWYCAQNPYPTSCADNQAAQVTHRALKAALRAAMDAVLAEGED